LEDPALPQPLTVPLTGGRNVAITPDASGDLNKPLVRVTDFQNKTLLNTIIDFNRQGAVTHHLARSAAALQQPEILQIVQAWEVWKGEAEKELAAAQEAATAGAAVAAAAEKTLRVRRRLLHESDDRCLFQDLTEVAQLVLVLRERTAPSETLLMWPRERLHQAAILDLDFHGDKQAPLEDIESLMRCLSPAPRLWWLTQGGGAHALYLPVEPCDAYELAVGGAAQLACDPTVVFYGGSVEIKAGTRHPAAMHGGRRCGPIHEMTPTASFQCMARLTDSGVAEDELADFLNDKGWKMGDAMPHSCCVIDPAHQSNSASPVFVGEKGLFCHSCHGRLGNGFRSWLQVMTHDGYIPSDDGNLRAVADAAKHLVHFNHVDYLFDALLPGVPSDFRRPLYKALLKITIKDPHDARIGKAFSDFSFVRARGHWLHAATLSRAKDLRKDDVVVLPSCLEWGTSAKGEPILKPIEEVVSQHVNTGLVKGWLPIEPHPFTPIYFHHNRPAASVHQVHCFPKRTFDTSVSYVDRERRISIEEAERRISEYFPGLSIKALRACLVMIGCAEAGVGRVPILWLTGPTGAAKSTCILIASCMFSEPVVDLYPAFGKDGRLSQTYADALDLSRFITVDDFAKDPELNDDILNFILHKHSTHTGHKLYKGAFPERIKAPIFLTDRQTPSVFYNDQQFGRRVHIIHLDEAIPVSWDTLGHYAHDWWKQTPELRAAACAFYSDVVDRFFSPGAPASADEAMRTLGVPLVKEASAGGAGDAPKIEALVQAFAYEVCRIASQVTVEDPMITRRAFSGAVKVDVFQSSALGKLATYLLETRGSAKAHWFNLERVIDDHTHTLEQTLGLKAAVKVQGKQLGREIYVRLVERDAPAHARGKWVNHALFNQWPPPPEADFVRAAREAGPSGSTAIALAAKVA
jgi:hypothetical protein